LALELEQVSSSSEEDDDNPISDEYAKLVKKNLDEFEDGLQEIPQDEWKFAINPVGFACMKCAQYIPANTQPPHIHARKPCDPEKKMRLRRKPQNMGKDPVPRFRVLFGRGF